MDPAEPAQWKIETNPSLERLGLRLNGGPTAPLTLDEARNLSAALLRGADRLAKQISVKRVQAFHADRAAAEAAEAAELAGRPGRIPAT